MRLFLPNFLVLALLFSGCGASYKPTLSRFDPVGTNSKKISVGDLTVYVEEYASAAKSIRAFDTDLAAAGILPILILVENNGPAAFDLKLQDVVIRRDQPLKALTPRNAAMSAERSAFGEAAGWSVAIAPIAPVVAPAAAALSAVETNRVNRQIDQDFSRKAFAGGSVEAGKRRSGFLFYQLEDKTPLLKGLILGLKATNLATNEMVSIDIALPETMLTPGEDSASR
jgi:hypothetical protein